MKYYRVQVRYNQSGEVKAVVAKHYDRSASDAADTIASLLAKNSHVIFEINDCDQFIVRSADVLNAVVIAE